MPRLPDTGAATRWGISASAVLSSSGRVVAGTLGLTPVTSARTSDAGA